MTPFPPIQELLPHRGNMLLLEDIVAVDDESVTCRALPDASAWYAEEHGNMPAWIGIELMAQAIAAHVALIARRIGKPPCPGVLLGTRAYSANVNHFSAGTVLQVTARLSYRDDSGLGAYDCALSDASGTELATAAITVFEPDDFDKFIRGERN